MPLIVSVGFSGSQKGMNTKQKNGVEALLDKLRPDEVHHGDCIGADNDFHSLCKKQRIKEIVIHPPYDPRKRAFCIGTQLKEEKDYIERNHDIVDSSDIMIFTPKGPEVMRSGTWSTVRYARKKQTRHFIVWPNGVVDRF